jgi:T5SS/PEP-CTERM-associated repeat protein
LLAISVLCRVAPVHAVTTNWNTNSSGTFGVAGNWDNGVPDTTKVAQFNRSGVTYTVTFVGSQVGLPVNHDFANRLLVGNNNVTFVKSSLTPVSPDLTVTSTDTTPTGRGVLIGVVSGDNAVLSTSIPVNCTSLDIGADNGAMGTLNVNGGTWTISGAVNGIVDIGDQGGAGTLNVSSGASVNLPNPSASALLGGGDLFGTLGNGTVNVSGPGSTLSIGGDLDAAIFGGAAALNITSGGHVSVGGGANFGNGVGTVTGIGSSLTAGGLVVGSKLNINSAAHVTTGGVTIPGAAIPAVSSVTVDGVGTLLTSTAEFDIGTSGSSNDTNGYYASAELNVTGGAHVIGSGSTYIAQQELVSGAVTVDGPGSQWSTGDLHVGVGSQIIFPASATLDVTGSAHVTTTGDATIAETSAATGRVTIDDQGSAWTITGALTVSGGGQATLIVKNGGSVSVGTNLSIGSLGTVKSNSLITGNVFNGGLLAPVSSQGTTHINGNYAQTNAGTLQLYLGGTNAGTNYNQLVVSGADSLAGTLEITLAAGFTPALGDCYDILDWGTRSGTFSTLQLPALTGTLGWNTDALYTSGVLSVIDTNFLPGDFDRDGHVNVADIAAAELALTDLDGYKAAHGNMTNAQLVSLGDLDGDGLVTSADVQGLIDLLANGGGVGAPSSATAVPEPSAIILLTLGGLLLSRTRSTRAISVSFTAAVALLAAAPARAIETDWISGSSGNVSAAGNWSNGVPDSTKVAVFGTGLGAASYTVTFNGAAPGFPPPQYQCNRLVVAGTNSVTFVKNSLQPTAPSLTALYTDTNSTLPSLVVGQSAGDTATLNTSVFISCTDAVIGVDELAAGTLNVSGGGLNADSLTVGGSGRGTLTINNGAAVNVGSLSVGVQLNPGSDGSRVAVTGAGSKLTVSGTGGLYVGGSAREAVMTISGGAQVSDPQGYIGYNAGSSGTVIVDGTGSTWTSNGSLANPFSVGQYGSGSLQITDGAQVSSFGATIATNSGAAGTVNVDGAGSQWTITGEFAELGVGSQGFGTLYITHGGHVTNNTDDAVIGDGDSALGTVTVDGASSAWTCNSTLRIANGALNITGGGQVSTSGAVDVGSGVYTIASVTVDGTGSTWVTTSDINLGSNMLANGTLTVRNGGLVSCSGLLTIGALGTLKGDGTISGAVSNGGVVAPGATLGALHINGSYVQSAAGTLEIELAGLTRGVQFDRLVVSGTASFNGTLQVSLAGGFAPSVGNAFDVLDVGTLGGVFSNLQLPALPAHLSWSTGQLYTSGTLFVISTLRGDVNQDDHVDVADVAAMEAALSDLSRYQTTHGSMNGAQLVSIGDLDGDNRVTNADLQSLIDLLANGGGIGAPSSIAVPEPCALVLAMIGLLCCSGRFCRRRSH